MFDVNIGNVNQHHVIQKSSCEHVYVYVNIHKQNTRKSLLQQLWYQNILPSIP